MANATVIVPNAGRLMPQESSEPRPAMEPASDQAVPEKSRGLAWNLALSSPLWLIPVWALLAYTTTPTPFTTLSGCVTVVLIVVCAYTDLRWGKIRNWATYTAMLWALAMATFDTVLCRPYLDEVGAASTGGLFGESAARLSSAVGTVSLGECLAGAALIFVVMLFVYRLAGGGAGDVKLATVLGALLGPSAGIDALIWTYVLAGVGIVAWMIVKIGPIKLSQWVFRKVGSRLVPTHVGPPNGDEFELLHGKVLLGPFFAMGTIAVLSGWNLYLIALVGG